MGTAAGLSRYGEAVQPQVVGEGHHVRGPIREQSMRLRVRVAVARLIDRDPADSRSAGGRVVAAAGETRFRRPGRVNARLPLRIAEFVPRQLPAIRQAQQTGNRPRPASSAHRHLLGQNVWIGPVYRKQLQDCS